MLIDNAQQTFNPLTGVHPPDAAPGTMDRSLRAGAATNGELEEEANSV